MTYPGTFSLCLSLFFSKMDMITVLTFCGHDEDYKTQCIQWFQNCRPNKSRIQYLFTGFSILIVSSQGRYHYTEFKSYWGSFFLHLPRLYYYVKVVSFVLFTPCGHFPCLYSFL